MLRRILSISLSFIIVLLLLSGCGVKETGPGIITIWHDKEDVVAAALQAELDKLGSDIVVQLEKKNGLTEALKMVGNDPSAAPDMYLFAHDKLGVYVEMGILSPITEFVDRETLSDFLPVTIDAATYKDHVYQLPIYFETLLFMYNRDLMADSEVPSTTEELFSFMQRRNSI